MLAFKVFPIFFDLENAVLINNRGKALSRRAFGVNPLHFGALFAGFGNVFLIVSA